VTPSFPAALSAYHAGDHTRAHDLLREAGEAVLGDPVALQLLGILQADLGDADAVYDHAALSLDPGNVQAIFNLGVADQRKGALFHALLRYEQALRRDPHHLGALNNLSDLLRRQGRSEEAWECLQRYLRAGGDATGLEIRLAKVADDCGLSREASEWFARAAARDDDRDGVRWEWAMQQLRDEEFADGWPHYELRRQRFGHEVLATVQYHSMPEWRGDALNGRSLLIHKEQGLGDTIMFASCLADLPGDRGQLHLAVPPVLVRLFASSFPDAAVWPSRSTVDTDQEQHQAWRPQAGVIDAHLPIGSLPLHLRREGFPAPRPYLRPLPQDVADWSARLARLIPGPRGLRVGLVLAARRGAAINPSVADGWPRSLPLHLASDLAVPGVQWFGLHERQYDDAFAQVPGLSIVPCGDWIHDMGDTAALIANLDVVVTVDTAVAHVAGAMGRKVILMLRRLGDWRWGRERLDSYWYPDVEIVRQVREGRWEPVVQQVARRLATLVAARD
jgi:hypothetical protein